MRKGNEKKLDSSVITLVSLSEMIDTLAVGEIADLVEYVGSKLFVEKRFS